LLSEAAAPPPSQPNCCRATPRCAVDDFPPAVERLLKLVRERSVDQLVYGPLDFMPLEDEHDLAGRDEHAVPLDSAAAEVERRSVGDELARLLGGARLQRRDDRDALHQLLRSSIWPVIGASP
jgi:hypothetical protein